MFIKRRVAAVALALALAAAGIAGGIWDSTDSLSSETTEQAGGTWS